MIWKCASNGLRQGGSGLRLFDQTQLDGGMGGCWDLRSVLTEGQVLGKFERAGSILSSGRMVKEAMELK